MAIRQINADTFEVDSSSSGSVYTVLWAMDGGNWYSCSCMAYVMNRNRAIKNSGSRQVSCKHTIQVDNAYPRRPTSPVSPPSPGGNTIKRYFEFVGGTSYKFWEVTYAPGATSFTVRFGRIGSNGQTQPKPCASAADAAKRVDKLINEKRNEGYIEIGTSPAGAAPAPQPAAAPPPAAPAAPRAQKLLPMLADEVDMDTIATYAADDDYVFEAKLDGQRVMIVIENGKVTAIGRDGQVSQHQPRFRGGKHKVDLDRLGNRTLVLDGELMMETGTFWVFDMPRFVGGAGMTFDLSEPWEIRRTALELVFAAWDPDPACYRLLPVSRTTEDKVALVKSQQANQGEGVIIKQVRRKGSPYVLDEQGEHHLVDGQPVAVSPYKPGYRGDLWLKAKFLHDADLIVTKVGVDGKNNAALSVFKDGGLVEVGKCSLNGKAAVKIGDVVVVRYLYLGANNRIVQPRLMNVRTDKPHNQCTFDQLIGTNKAAATSVASVPALNIVDPDFIDEEGEEI